MPLPSAPASISLNQVNVELGLSGTATITLNDTAVRSLFGKPSGQISMSDGYGKTNIWKNSLTKGFYASGLSSTPTPGVSTTVDKITYSTETRSGLSSPAPSNALNKGKIKHSAAGNSDKAFISGGFIFTPGTTSTATSERATYSTEAIALVAGANLTVPKDSHGAAGNVDKGFYNGGYSPFSPTNRTAAADRTTYSTETTAGVPGANLTAARAALSGVGNADKGFFSGGNPSPGVDATTANRTTYSTETTAAVPGANLSQGRSFLSSSGNADKGFFYGGATGAAPPLGPGALTGVFATADRTTYSTETTAAVSGANLTQARAGSGGAGTSDKGFAAGGQTPTTVTTADRTTYSTETTAAVPGANLSSARQYVSGV